MPTTAADLLAAASLAVAAGRRELADDLIRMAAELLEGWPREGPQRCEARA